jgi:hypothetical protein
VPGQRRNLNLKDRSCDDELRAEDYCTPHGAVICEDGAVVEWQLARKNERNSDENLLHRHFVHRESHMYSPEIEHKAV